MNSHDMNIGARLVIVLDVTHGADAWTTERFDPASTGKDILYVYVWNIIYI